MIDNDTVLYEGTINGEEIRITFGQAFCQNENVARKLGHGAILRALNSAATNAGEEEGAKDAARLARAYDIINGEDWQSGGGNMLSEAERTRRHVLASYATTHAGLKRSEAEDKARKDYAGLLSMTAAAIIKKRDGKKPDKARLESGIEKFRQTIEAEVSRLLSDDTIAEI